MKCSIKENKREEINNMAKTKTKRKPSAWNLHSMKVYKEMKAKDDSVKFSAALKKAAKTFVKKK